MRATFSLFLCLFVMSLLTGGPTLARASEPPPDLVLACSPRNDLVTALRESGVRFKRFDTARDAVRKAAPGSAVLVLAEGYPAARTRASLQVLGEAGDKRIRLYLEFPSVEVSGGRAEPGRIQWERAVVTGEGLGESLPGGRILMLPDARFVDLPPGNLLLVLARVAGFDTADYGYPRSAIPLLVEYPERRLILAASRLSCFRSGRYAPAKEWAAVWETILAKLRPGQPAIRLKPGSWAAPAYSGDAKLPPDVERQALRRGVAWYRRSGLLLDDARRKEALALLSKGGATMPLPVAPKSGDGSFGVLEGLASNIRYDGRQDYLVALRADCTAETAMVFALDALVNGSRESRETARRLLDHTFSTFVSGVRADPAHPAFGLIAWGVGSRAWETANYGDDNARTILAALAASASMGESRWDGPLMTALLANLRTTGPYGFRGDRIDLPELERLGWRHFQDRAIVNPAPNFEAYLWACNLLAYRQSGYTLFLAKAIEGIRRTMEVYPQGWRWKDSLERARMLLPLAWLVRVEDTAEHRMWLARVADDLLKLQQPSGALREEFKGGGGHLQAPSSNEAYGTGEAPLAQNDGDPVTDQLYTTGFALIGLHEAAAATGDARYRQAEDLLAGYLCRIQVRAPRLPFIDGAWLRALDYRRWDYWGSAADVGWGPWNAEAGWGPAWINAGLALRARQTSLWELTAGSAIGKQFDSAERQLSVNDGGPLRR